MDDDRAIPICPGCHFRCHLDDYQCGRGAKLYDKWQVGGEIPARHTAEGQSKPVNNDNDGDRKPLKLHANLPTPTRLMILVGIANRMISDRNDAARGQRVAEYVMRKNGSATNRIISESTRLDNAAVEEQIAALEEAGIVTSRTLEDGRVFHDITEAGREQAKVWMEEHRASDAEFYSALTDEEAGQLEALLAKALEPHMRRGPKR